MLAAIRAMRGYEFPFEITLQAVQLPGVCHAINIDLELKQIFEEPSGRLDAIPLVLNIEECICERQSLFDHQVGEDYGWTPRNACEAMDKHVRSLELEV